MDYRYNGYFTLTTTGILTGWDVHGGRLYARLRLRLPSTSPCRVGFRNLCYLSPSRLPTHRIPDTVVFEIHNLLGKIYVFRSALAPVSHNTLGQNLQDQPTHSASIVDVWYPVIPDNVLAHGSTSDAAHAVPLSLHSPTASIADRPKRMTLWHQRHSHLRHRASSPSPFSACSCRLGASWQHSSHACTYCLPGAFLRKPVDKGVLTVPDRFVDVWLDAWQEITEARGICVLQLLKDTSVVLLVQVQCSLTLVHFHCGCWLCAGPVPPPVVTGKLLKAMWLIFVAETLSKGHYKKTFIPLKIYHRFTIACNCLMDYNLCHMHLQVKKLQVMANKVSFS